MSGQHSNDGQDKQEHSQLSRPSTTLKRIKTEKSPNRLPSLRGPRDLTLGGIKKKTFAPNIPIRKDRPKTEVKNEKSSSKTREDKSIRSRDARPRGRGRGMKAQVIQSHSIFESGPGSSQSSRGRGSSSSSTSSAPPQMEKPIIKKEKFDKAKEEQESESVMKRLGEGNVSMIADLQNDENLKPVLLPLSDVIKVRCEAGSSGRNSDAEVADVLRNTEGKLMLLQIPDSLPGVFASSDDSEPIKQEHRETSKSAQTHHRCDLEGLNSGSIGKLQIMKSGRCRLVFGGLNLHLKLGTPSSSSQEIVSVQLPPDDDGDNGQAHVNLLGEVGGKLVCVPDIARLIRGD